MLTSKSLNTLLTKSTYIKISQVLSASSKNFPHICCERTGFISICREYNRYTIYSEEPPPPTSAWFGVRLESADLTKKCLDDAKIESLAITITRNDLYFVAEGGNQNAVGHVAFPRAVDQSADFNHVFPRFRQELEGGKIQVHKCIQKCPSLYSLQNAEIYKCVQKPFTRRMERK